MDRILKRSRWAATMLLLVVLGSPATAEYYSTLFFLDRDREEQITYVIGLADMYSFARDDFAADPDDWLIPCLRGKLPADIHAIFLDWLLDNPAAWRQNPPELFLEAMDQACN